MQVPNDFYHIHVSNLVEVGVLILAYLGYRKETSKAKTDQLLLHKENQMKMDAIIEFNKSQVEANRQRDTQVNLLSTQTAQLTTLAQGFERRLTMLEDRDT